MDETLRKEVRFLTTRLGAMVREQCGEKTFQAVENLRQLSKQIRQNPDPRLLCAKEREINGLTLSAATNVAHAFSLFFHLVNLCEERQRVRRLQDYERQESGAPMSLRRVFRELRRQRVAPARVKRLIESMRVEPVLTAHPTEAKRRSVMNHLYLIAQTLDLAHGDLSAVTERQIDPWIEALWLTDEVRERPMTPATEIESTLVYLERTIYDLAGTFGEKFREELARYSPRLWEHQPVLRFGWWVGTDRDGNPNVTPEVSRRAAEKLRESILRYYRRSCEHLLRIVSFPCRQPALRRRLESDLARDVRRFPATRIFESVDQPHELYRRKLRIMAWRLDRTLEGGKGAYGSPAEFVRDVGLLEQLLADHPSPRIARLGPARLRQAAMVFGFHGASLDFRQHASRTRAAVDEILARAGRAAAPEAERIRSIQALLYGPGAAPRLSELAARTLEEFRTLREIQERSGESAAHRYVLSMSSKLSDVWDVLLLGRYAGLVQTSGRLWKSSFDVIPLFETFDDLAACPSIFDRLLSDRLYRALLASRGNFQEVMLGYSDSVKDSGYFAANWSLFRAQKKLEAVADRHGIKLGLFHGMGGTIDRGGGQSYRSVHAQPHAAPGGRIRITEQGEVISLKYSNPVIAERNIEQLVASVLDARLLRPRNQTDLQVKRWEAAADELGESSRRFYRRLVYETSEFPEYFYQATPIDLIEQLRLGSRPSRRFRGRDVENLRAIPWVFAWTQSRHFLPSWYGLGHAFERFIHDHAPDGLSLLREMYQNWPFFAVLLQNAEVSLAKTDLYIARRYAALVRPVALGQRIFQSIEEEYHRSLRHVLDISGRGLPLAGQPVLAESIRLRNPYVDPLNFLQLRFLEKWRRSRRSDPELLRLLQITVGGIAFGMKSTG